MWRELKRITDSVPQDLIRGLMKKEIIAPTARMLFGKALEDSSITPEQRERFQLILDSGVLDREVDVVDFDTEKAIDAYLEAEIALSVKAGRLPKEAPQWEKLKAKGKKYARKQQARLKELFDSERDSAGDAESDTGIDAIADSARESDDEVLSETSSAAAGQEEA